MEGDGATHLRQRCCIPPEMAIYTTGRTSCLHSLASNIAVESRRTRLLQGDMKHCTLVTTALLVVVLVLCTWPQVSEGSNRAICPHCTCPPILERVCARRKDNGVVRGFSSPCVLYCTNKCRPNKKKFEFVKKGRCGNLRSGPT